MKNVAQSKISEGALRALIAHRVEGLSRTSLLELLRQSRSFEEVAVGELQSCGLHQLAERWRNPDERRRALDDLTEWEEEGIRAIPLGSNDYPRSLESIADPPLLLFVQGESFAKVFEKPGLGIVGSRRGDSLGCSFASDVACEFARRSGCVVSGLAVGIDGAAHRGALAAGPRGSTIAVLGSGHHTIYPAMHRPLAREILGAGGLLVSQFEPDTKPFPANFLNRNRVIAGLSLGVLVVQAAIRSGALVTARSALDDGREVFIVPGGISDPLFGGSNRLLRAGATPITELEDVFESFPVELKPPAMANSTEEARGSSIARTPDEDHILQALRSGVPTHLDTLVEGLGGDLHGAILELELAGEIVRLPGNYIQRLNGVKSQG